MTSLCNNNSIPFVVIGVYVLCIIRLAQKTVILDLSSAYRLAFGSEMNVYTQTGWLVV